MASRYEAFDRSRLIVKPLAERVNDLEVSRWMALTDEAPAFSHADLPEMARRLAAAKERGAARILMMGS